MKALRRAWVNERIAHLSDDERRILEAAVEILLRFDEAAAERQVSVPMVDNTGG
jgi:hypothetical protein